MSHDLVAELNGLHTERINLAAAGKTDRVKQIDEHIERVRTQVRERAEELETEAQEFDDAGQDLRAAERRVQARTLLQAAGEEEEKPARSGRGRGGRGGRGSSASAGTDTAPATQTAADTTPTEKAVTAAAPATE